MRKVAIPTDLSANAFNAFEYAVSLFNEPSVFYLMHAYAGSIYNENNVKLSDTELESLREKTSSDCESKLTRLVDEIKTKHPNSDHQFKTLTQCGYLIDEVVQLVRSENIDVLVMGTKGATNDRNITFGSNTLQVLKNVQCPVLCVPDNYKYKRPEKLLFPTNYMVPYQKRELELVDEICSYYNAELHMLYISNIGIHSNRQKENQAFLKTQIYNATISFHQAEESSKTNVINDTIEKMDIDLLVMVNSRHTYLENLLSKTTIDKIGLNPKIPFLVLQNFIRTDS
ncbi:MAG: universal stress protein [Flavobacteriaceae bacterium]